MIYQIENEKLLVKVCSLGATLNTLIHKNTNLDIVLGFNNEKDYLYNKGPYLGATVARCANRIGEGTYKINGETYHAPINNGPNTLHGGKGISFEEFDLIEENDTKLVFQKILKDKEDGYPGNLKLTVIYEIVDDELIISFKGLSDKDTLFNVTNHSYFNMNGGSGTCLDEYLTLFSDKVALNDEDGMATLNMIDVKDTSFDFTNETLIKDNFDKKHPNLSNGGIDHNYIFEKMGEKKLAKLRGEKLSLLISSDLPDFQVYTANWFSGEIGKENNIYCMYKGIAIEPQFYPNAINYDGLLKPILRANEEITHFIKYTVKELQDELSRTK